MVVMNELREVHRKLIEDHDSIRRDSIRWKVKVDIWREMSDEQLDTHANAN